jgi:hypothetical protein
MVTSFSVHPDEAEAVQRGLDGFRFFQFALGHHYAFGEHVPGRTDIWQKYIAVRDHLGTEGLGGGTGGIGTPAQLRDHLQQFADAGVDQTVFIQQGGKNQHEHICEALELFAADVMPEFKERESERERQKAQDLAPYVEAGFKRKQYMAEMADDAIPSYQAYGFNVAEVDTASLPEANRRRAEAMRRIREVALKA